MNDDFVFTVSLADIRRAFAEWEQDRRDGKCLSHEEFDAMSMDESVATSAKCFARYLLGLQ